MLGCKCKKLTESCDLVRGVKALWKKLNLPIQQGKFTIERKLENVLKKYENQECKTLPTFLM